MKPGRFGISWRFSRQVRIAMRLMTAVLVLTASLMGQGKRLWILRAPGEMVEYDLATFAAKQTVKVPPEASRSPGNILLNRLGQILFQIPVSLPLSDDDTASAHKVWIWNGQAAITLDQGVQHKTASTGSNEAITESAPVVYLSSDGNHLFWFANQTRRLQRENIDLSTETTWQAWQTDLSGAERQELVSVKLPDCRCTTGTCEETCPSGVVWTPEEGVKSFFLMTQVVAGQTKTEYKASTLHRLDAAKWNASALSEPLQRVLDADSNGNVVVHAMPDTGCCGWSNESNDQTLVMENGKARSVFDEQATYKNPDYDVSFFTSNAHLSPELGYVAMTIATSAQPNKGIQLAEEGQASPEESQRIRKAVSEMPVVEVKSMGDSPRQVASVPHATLVGWISEKELLIVENHVLVTYTLGTGTRRKSSVKVEDAARVFLR
jgi:hypothetical protein